MRRSFLVSQGLVHNGKGARTFPNDGMGLSFQVLETCITATIKLGLNGLEAAKIISGPGRVPFKWNHFKAFENSRIRYIQKSSSRGLVGIASGIEVRTHVAILRMNSSPSGSISFLSDFSLI